MTSKTLIIKRNKGDVFFGKLDNIESYYNVPPTNIFLRVCRKFHLPFEAFFYGDWKSRLNDCDNVILFDNGYNPEIPKYIKNKNKNIRIIFWYWNSLVELGNKIIDTEYIDEIWTYNRFDSKNFNLKYNPQFYLKMFDLENKETNTDVLFLGRDKGREESLRKLESELNGMDVITNFKIVKTSADTVKYPDYLKLLEESKCILDYSFTLPCGLSLRPLEALFYEKKLITNNSDIKNYDFYDSNNIFILGEDDINKIKEFIDKPYKKIDEKIVRYYDFYSWISRFGGK